MSICRIVKINMGDHMLDCNIVVPADKYASTNFKYRELMDPTTCELILCPLFLFIMQMARTRSKCSIVVDEGLSWYRGKIYNRLVGGSDNSAHINGTACDSKWFNVYGFQLHPIQCAYMLRELAEMFNLTYELGVYLPGYDGSDTGGYVHFAIFVDRQHTYYYDTNNMYHRVQSLEEINVNI